MINKVLVVNDDATSLLITCKMLNKAQFANEMVTAGTGEQALAFFENLLQPGTGYAEEAPEFIFLDLYMAIMSGWDFLDIFSKKFASLFPGVRVAVLSSYIDQEDILRLEKYKSVLAFIPTPVSLDKLLAVKEKFLQIKRMELLNSFSINYN